MLFLSKCRITCCLDFHGFFLLKTFLVHARMRKNYKSLTLLCKDKMFYSCVSVSASFNFRWLMLCNVSIGCRLRLIFAIVFSDVKSSCCFFFFCYFGINLRRLHVVTLLWLYTSWWNRLCAIFIKM